MLMYRVSIPSCVVMQHIYLVKGSDDPNTYLVNDTADPLQRSLTCLELTDVLMGAPPPGASTTWPPPTGLLVLCQPDGARVCCCNKQPGQAKRIQCIGSSQQQPRLAVCISQWFDMLFMMSIQTWLKKYRYACMSALVFCMHDHRDFNNSVLESTGSSQLFVVNALS